jgi:hypothetical protein
MLGTLLLKNDAKEVSREELAQAVVPEGSKTWFPVPHIDVLTGVEESLTNAGFEISNHRLALARNGLRMFATLDLTSPVGDGVNLAVGLRNSNDRSYPMALVVGHRVFCCSNLAFSRDEIEIARRHTRHGRQRFSEGISQAVQSLSGYADLEAQRIETLRGTSLTDDRANSLLLQAWEKGIIGVRTLPKVIEAYREPSHEDFLVRSAWSLLNAFTLVLRERFQKYPQQAASETQRFQALLLN